jgi:hypothetical protein
MGNTLVYTWAFQRERTSPFFIYTIIIIYLVKILFQSAINGTGHARELSLLLVLSLATRVFLHVLRFSSLHKNQHSKFQFDRNEGRNEN